MHSVSLVNALGAFDPELSVVDPIESSSQCPPPHAAQTATVLPPAPIHNSIFREPDGRLNRPLIAVLTVAGLLTLGHFVCSAPSRTPMWVDDVAKMVQVILSQELPRREMPLGITPAAPISNPEHELRSGQA